MYAAGYTPSQDIPVSLQRALYLEPLFGEHGSEVLSYVNLFKESIERYSGSINRCRKSTVSFHNDDVLAAFSALASKKDHKANISVSKSFLGNHLCNELSIYMPSGVISRSVDKLIEILLAVANQSSPMANQAYETAKIIRQRMETL